MYYQFNGNLYLLYQLLILYSQFVYNDDIVLYIYIFMVTPLKTIMHKRFLKKKHFYLFTMNR